MSQRHGASEIWFVFPDAWPRASRPVCAYQTVSGGFSALPTPFFSSSHSLFQLLSISPPYWGLSLHLSQHHQVKMEAVLCPPDLLLKGTFSRGKGTRKTSWRLVSFVFILLWWWSVAFLWPSFKHGQGCGLLFWVHCCFPPPATLCDMPNLIPWSGIKPRLPALEGEVLTVKS